MGIMFLWIILAAGALIVDILTSNILFVSFTIGGIFAIIANSLKLSSNLQIIIFILVSLISLALIYPLITKKLKKTVAKTLLMEQSYIGRKVQIEEDIIEKGKIKVDGIYWTAKNESDPLHSGDTAIIVGIEGNKLSIKKYLQ
jgi:membrane protein implicated in regulation of membrane protease activity